MQHMYRREPGSSDNMVSGYELDDRTIEVRSPAGTKNFSSNLCVQTSSGAHPDFCTMGTGGPFPGAKSQPGLDADHSPHLFPRSRMSRSYSSSPPSVFVVCGGTALAFNLYIGSCVWWVTWKNVRSHIQSILLPYCKWRLRNNLQIFQSA
jgi:hypothetical protein